MNRYLAAFFALLIVLFFGTFAFAKTYQQGKAHPIRTIACDEFEQLHAIFSTLEEQGTAYGVATYRSLNRQRNALGEPVCGSIQGSYVLGDIRGTYTIEGEVSYIVELANVRTGRVLYAIWSSNLVIVPPGVQGSSL